MWIKLDIDQTAVTSEAGNTLFRNFIVLKTFPITKFPVPAKSLTVKKFKIPFFLLCAFCNVYFFLVTIEIHFLTKAIFLFTPYGT